MHWLIVHSHPEPDSFNGALTATARRALEGRGDSIEVSDLYGEGFDPVEGPAHYAERADSDYFAALGEQRHAWKAGALAPEVTREIARLQRAEGLILQFPLWWHGPPAILKGWMDRVFISGGLYTSRMRYDNGYFRGRTALCAVTTGAPAETLGPGSRGGDPDTMLWPVEYSLHYMGFRVLTPFIAPGVQGHGYSYQDAESADGLLQRHLARWHERLVNLHTDAPRAFPGWEDWDESGRARRPQVSGP
ncbi:NAD(P)H-dependent oxidoreductase [Halofilum ochraceum]|uniref:NAD(P)H-dependent oxidoreductase n=1 Tax=Halofilum ochraceum TaxID=1611323 RepID=UPI0008DAA934|nr:NAD(P)H-dependent oxidoreductase [Halofilum ochraceum]